MTFQDLLLAIQGFWSAQGCVLQQPYDTEIGAGTMHPDTFFRVLGPEPWRVAYCQPSRRPVDGRYGDNPMRLYKHYQFQVILKPAPLDVQEIYLESLKAFGVDPGLHDIRFEEDNWEAPTLGAAGVGWQVVMDGMEISQFTYFQQSGGHELNPISVELTYGLERICMYLNDVRDVYEIPWNETLTYGDVRHTEEVEHSIYSFELADTEFFSEQLDRWEAEAGRLLDHERSVEGETVAAPVVLPAYEAALKCSHLFNVLDARGAFSVTERAANIQRVRRLACRCADAWLTKREGDGFPLVRVAGEANKVSASAATLLLEIGCEEIPARMIADAGQELERRVVELLDDAGLDHGPACSWSGSRRLCVSVATVVGRQEDRDEQVLGPPAKIAFDDDGRPTPAAVGFSRKQGIDPAELLRVETDRGSYAGFDRRQQGKTVGEILAEGLPARVASMPFPKSMRWADGKHRWVRPVHWVLALYGRKTLDLELFGIASGNRSVGHRFRSGGAVTIKTPQSYVSSLEQARVMVDPAQRRERVAELLAAAAARAGGVLVEDPRLLDEVANLVEWPGVVLGRFDESFLELPTEILATTLRHHQKCFSLVDSDGNAFPAFLAVTNTDEDPGGHIQRGNEWVVGGRLDDAGFFWREDRRRPLADLSADLGGVVFHARVGSFADKTSRMKDLATSLGQTIGLDAQALEQAASAASVCKNDLLTGTVGEFPELQGQVGGLLLRAEGRPEAVAQAVYEHYRPTGANAALPQTVPGRIVSVADKLDSIASLIGAGETPTGSRDPLGLRRASSGVFRIVVDAGWNLSVNGLSALCSGGDAVADFLAERLKHYLRESGATENEIRAIQRPEINAVEWRDWPLGDIAARLEAIARVRDRSDFEQLADLTKRVDNILTKGEQAFAEAGGAAGASDFVESAPSAQLLGEKIATDTSSIADLLHQQSYETIVDRLAGYVDPVEQFFVEVLVVDKDNPAATLARRDLMHSLQALLTGCFDLRELAGQALKKGS